MDAPGADIEDLKKQFAGKYIDYDDHRINSIIIGYIIQALFFFLTTIQITNILTCSENLVERFL
jgi:hypothetical protein